MTQFSRVAIPKPEDMDEDQRQIFEQAVAFFGEPIGPRMALIVSPLVARQWSELLVAIQASNLPKKFWELSILVVARFWNSDFEFWAHEKKALAEGMDQEIVEAIKCNRTPKFSCADEKIVYGYCHELMYERSVSEKTYEALRNLIGTRQLVELTVLMGHYSSVAMTLVAHEVALPKGVVARLPKLPDNKN